MTYAAKRSIPRAEPKKPVAPRLKYGLRAAELPGDDFGDDATLTGVEYTGVDLTGRAAEAVEAEGCRFEGARFTGSELTRCVFSDCAFETADFANVRSRNVALVRCGLSASRLLGSSWAAGSFRNVVFEGCRGDLALFRDAKFSTVTFLDCVLRQADFQRAEFRDVRFVGCDLTGARFAHATMANAYVENCTLADVGGAQSMKGATVRGPGALDLALTLARDAGITIEL
jgi:uncharacterized protein YjbI with pentapeptide repeats